MEKLRILLVDDHVLFRKGIASLIENREDIEIVGEANNGAEALIKARDSRPEVVLMDLNMPVVNGLEAVRTFKEELPEVNIIMLTVSDDDDDVFEAVKSGAKGYLLKNMEPTELFEMLKGVRRGEAAISGSVAVKILQEFRQPTDDQQDSKIDDLTPREVEVLEEVVKGCTNKEIAKTLSITENTVKIHLRNILSKLHVKNRIQAAVHAVREGLIEEE